MDFHASVIFKSCSCFLFLFLIVFWVGSGLIFVIDSVASKYVCLGVGVQGISCGLSLGRIFCYFLFLQFVG